MASRPTMPLARGFTLIELLIVCAIIAVLAAIAVPNFLEAQTRAKVSRTKADLRTLATAVETYCVDYNQAPLNDGLFNIPPRELSTPVAYLTATRLVDPFNDKEFDPVYGDLARFYTYGRVVFYAESLNFLALGRGAPVEAVDDRRFNPGAFEKYGKWRLVGWGPDRQYSSNAAGDPNPATRGSDIPYDPTNGTTSFGNLLRTQKDVDRK